MEKFIIEKIDEHGNVIDTTIPLPKDYIEELVPPFPIESNTIIVPFNEKEETKNDTPILG